MDNLVAVGTTTTAGGHMDPSGLLEIFARYGGLVGLLMAVIIMGCGYGLITMWKQLQIAQALLVTKTTEFQEALKVQAVEYSKALNEVHERRIADGDRIRDQTSTMFERHREAMGRLADGVSIVNTGITNVAASVASLRDTVLLVQGRNNNDRGTGG